MRLTGTSDFFSPFFVEESLKEEEGRENECPK
jgi:hypothetical protein